jgi:hypothetical protein
MINQKIKRLARAKRTPGMSLSQRIEADRALRAAQAEQSAAIKAAFQAETAPLVGHIVGIAK